MPGSMLTDTIIIGAGPAGLAAGIALRQAGANVKILEVARHPANGPGETLHPGAEVIFNQLGIGDAIRAKSLIRHMGIMIEHAGVETFQAYGQDWRGFQIRKGQITNAMCERFLALGGDLNFGCSATHYHRSNGLHRVRQGNREIQARWLLDATGCAGWLDRQLPTAMIDHSPRIWLHYGYYDAVRDSDFPTLSVRPDCWRWEAPLGAGQTAWVEGRTNRTRSGNSHAKIMDGTWKVSAQPAGDYVFRLGDAACRLDPRNGHGILRAMMSGIMAAHLIGGVENDTLTPDAAARSFNTWLQTWFEYDAQQLRELQLVSSEIPKSETQPDILKVSNI